MQSNTNQPAEAGFTLPGGRTVNPWLALVSLLFGFFMALLDATIMNIAIPDIQTKLQTDLTTVTWALNAYSLTFAVLLVTMGRLADQYGRKRIFMFGMIVFSLASLLCALSGTIGGWTGTPGVNWLIGFRALQGIGASSMNAVSLALVTAIFPAEKRGAAMGVWGASSGLAAAAGPVLGGFLIQNFDWRWIFFVNLPFCLVGLVMVTLFVPENRDHNTSKAVDVAGVLTLSGTIFCLVLAIMQGNDWGWSSPTIIGLLVATVVLLALFVLVELRQRYPIVDFSLFKRRSFSATNVVMFLFGFAMQGGSLILVLYFVNLLGYDELGAAYALIPFPLASFVVSAIAGRIRTNPQILGLIGTFLLTVSLVTFALLTPDASYLDIVWRGILFGAGMGLVFQAFPAIVLSEVPRTKLGVGSGIFNTFRQIGFSLGVAVLISLFTGQIQANMQQASTNAVSIVQADTKLPQPMRDGIVQGLKSAKTNSSNYREGASGGNSSNQFDLTKLADQLPPQVPEQQRNAIRTELKDINSQIQHEFKAQMTHAFTATWWAAAVASLLSFLGAFLARAPKRSEINTEQAKELAMSAH
ncbi:EmrB/QacA subfamily drug resistance transporter [Thermosporothrix hazakensis]|jgi:EmrB/QacA subfamily drug resistance transporter|uniref:EmrB/QacA subfamily drug resistance transporter n=1 Tax=Thermosporothrix hazakensis TaxID=644383 RepID=A0A326UDH8_THEHA|nr:MFS transporter [Thermosporothrix hazakensis]PZW27456.1 EmrB/QacA subfamily drug resistance transporter [Thermosporothrix hazakensis]GCE45622.1 hypothetical protein KTH_04910 [Thermosporothrix hazakensis]